MMQRVAQHPLAPSRRHRPPVAAAAAAVAVAAARATSRPSIPLPRPKRQTCGTWGVSACNQLDALSWRQVQQRIGGRVTAAAAAPSSSASSGGGGDDDADADDTVGDGEEGGGGPLEELSSARHVIVEPDFLDAARALRAVFEARFRDPRATSVERFCWDYWHVEGQYSLIRTQAAAYFPPDLYDALEAALISYGERALGCRAISPIWMSYYVDGHYQGLHCDSFHGPFAYVFSLTDWDGDYAASLVNSSSGDDKSSGSGGGGGARQLPRLFTGGETMILKPTTLDFWAHFQAGRGLEAGDLADFVPPRFNQLTLFDPRLPHGVREVRGTRDPLKGRLVLHGWFTEPSPFAEGGLEADADAVAEGLNPALDAIYAELELLPAVVGTLTVRATVRAADGRVARVDFLADTLVVRPGQPIVDDDGDPLPSSAARAAVQHAVKDGLMAAEFPAAAADTRITYPFVFE